MSIQRAGTHSEAQSLASEWVPVPKLSRTFTTISSPQMESKRAVPISDAVSQTANL